MKYLLQSATASILVVAGIISADPIGTGFTYQGELVQNDMNVTDQCDFNFGLWDAAAAGLEVAASLDVPNVSVNDGVFTVELDFGSGVFNGDARWLEIAVACPAGGGLTTLAPRQELTPSPNSRYATEAGTTDWSGITNIPPDIADGDDIVTNGNAHDHNGGDGGLVDHGALAGRTDDDHTIYLERDGSDSMSGNLDMGGNNISNVGDVDGVAVSAHAASNSAHDAVTANTANRIVLRDGSGGFSAGAVSTSSIASTGGADLKAVDGDLIDLSTINSSSTSEGLILPQATSTAAALAEGQISWDTDDDVLYVGNGVIPMAIRTTVTYILSAGTGSTFAACTGGAEVVGGGCSSIAGDAIQTSCPSTSTPACDVVDPTGWYCVNVSGGAISAYAICAN